MNGCTKRTDYCEIKSPETSRALHKVTQQIRNRPGVGTQNTHAFPVTFGLPSPCPAPPHLQMVGPSTVQHIIITARPRRGPSGEPHCLQTGLFISSRPFVTLIIKGGGVGEGRGNVSSLSD